MNSYCRRFIPKSPLLSPYPCPQVDFFFFLFRFCFPGTLLMITRLSHVQILKHLVSLTPMNVLFLTRELWHLCLYQ